MRVRAPVDTFQWYAVGEILQEHKEEGGGAYSLSVPLYGQLHSPLMHGPCNTFAKTWMESETAGFSSPILCFNGGGGVHGSRVSRDSFNAQRIHLR